MADVFTAVSVHCSVTARASTGHNEQGGGAIKSRLPLGRLAEVRGMNTRAGRTRYAAGFGDAAPPDPRPLAPVVPFARRRR